MKYPVKAIPAVVFSCIALSCVQRTESVEEEQPPNVIVIFTDDQGYADVGWDAGRL